MNVGIEFEPELLIENIEETLSLINDIGRDSLGVNLDIGHAAVYEEDVAESIRRSAGSITGSTSRISPAGDGKNTITGFRGKAILIFRRSSMLSTISDMTGLPHWNCTPIPPNQITRPRKRKRSWIEFTERARKIEQFRERMANPRTLQLYKSIIIVGIAVFSVVFFAGNRVSRAPSWRWTSGGWISDRLQQGTSFIQRIALYRPVDHYPDRSSKHRDFRFWRSDQHPAVQNYQFSI